MPKRQYSIREMHSYLILAPPPLKKQCLEERLVILPVSYKRLHQMAALRRRLAIGLPWKPCNIERNQRIDNKTCQKMQCVLHPSFFCFVVNNLASSELPTMKRNVHEPSPLLDVADIEMVDVQEQAEHEYENLIELFNKMCL